MIRRRRKPDPPMRKLPEALILHRETRAVIGFAENGLYHFPYEWGGSDDYDGFVIVPVPQNAD